MILVLSHLFSDIHILRIVYFRIFFDLFDLVDLGNNLSMMSYTVCRSLVGMTGSNIHVLHACLPYSSSFQRRSAIKSKTDPDKATTGPIDGSSVSSIDPNESSSDSNE